MKVKVTLELELEIYPEMYKTSGDVPFSKEAVLATETEELRKNWANWVEFNRGDTNLKKYSIQVVD